MGALQEAPFFFDIGERVMSNDLMPTVLIVDDNEDIVELMEMEMEMVDFKIFKAYGGIEAKKIIQENPNIQFILSDTNMPEGDGYELLKFVKEFTQVNGSIIYFYFITGDMDTQSMDIVGLGAKGIYSKPFDFDKIVSEIRSLHEINKKKEI